MYIHLLSTGEKIVLFLLAAPATLLTIWTITGLVIAMNAQVECLEQGYPEVVVTYNYDTYCVGYEGVVNPVVEEN